MYLSFFLINLVSFTCVCSKCNPKHESVISKTFAIFILNNHGPHVFLFSCYPATINLCRVISFFSLGSYLKSRRQKAKQTEFEYIIHTLSTTNVDKTIQSYLQERKFTLCRKFEISLNGMSGKNKYSTELRSGKELLQSYFKSRLFDHENCVRHAY